MQMRVKWRIPRGGKEMEMESEHCGVLARLSNDNLSVIMDTVRIYLL